MALTSFSGVEDKVFRKVSGSRTGTRTASATWTITLGFEPKVVRVINLTDRVQAEQFKNSNLDGGSNAKGLVRVAAGTTTYEATGIAISGRGFTVTSATVGLETDNDDVVWEAEG